MKGIKQACKWLDSNGHLFQGVVRRPNILNMEEEDAVVALTAYKRFFEMEEGEEHQVREPFLFEFRDHADMELFNSEVNDKRGVRVSTALF